MKRFLVFSGDYYYPKGGWRDFTGSFATIKEAEESCKNSEWGQIVENGNIVKQIHNDLN